nr:hypothetical protein [Nocardioides sambongensis]
MVEQAAEIVGARHVARRHLDEATRAEHGAHELRPQHGGDRSRALVVRERTVQDLDQAVALDVVAHATDATQTTAVHVPASEHLLPEALERGVAAGEVEQSVPVDVETQLGRRLCQCLGLRQRGGRDRGP